MPISIHAKTELLPLTHHRPCCCVKFEIIIYYQSYLFVCQIIPKILKISVCVSNYTKDICSCVKLYRSYLFVCQICNNYLLPKLLLATNIYCASTHSLASIYYYLPDHLLPTRSITCSVQKHLNFV